MLIYKISNKIDNKSYIGQTTKSFDGRYPNEQWWKTTHNEYLLEAVKEFGLVNFGVEFLAENIESQEELDRLEVLYIKEFDTMYPNGYNGRLGGGNGKYSEQAKDNVAISWNKGKIFKLKNQQTGQIVEFININRFCRENNACSGSIRMVLKGKRDMCGYWTLPETIIKKYEVSSPNNESHSIFKGEQKLFCDKHNLSPCQFNKVINGHVKYHLGWKLSDTEDEICELLSPNQEIIKFRLIDINIFCSKFSLSPTSIREIISGKTKSHKGWRLPNTILKVYKLISPQGERFNLFRHEWLDFSIKYKLSIRGIRAVLYNDQKQYKGWTKDDS